MCYAMDGRTDGRKELTDRQVSIRASHSGPSVVWTMEYCYNTESSSVQMEIRTLGPTVLVSQGAGNLQQHISSRAVVIKGCKVR